MSDNYLSRLTNGDLVGMLDMETYPKAIQFANKHNYSVQARASTLAGMWWPRLYVILSPPHVFCEDGEGHFVREDFSDLSGSGPVSDT